VEHDVPAAVGGSPRIVGEHFRAALAVDPAQHTGAPLRCAPVW